jgi:hypothetical protein
MAELTGALTAYRARANSMAAGHRRVSAAQSALGLASGISAGITMGTGNVILGAAMLSASSSMLGFAQRRADKASRWNSKGKAVESLVMRARDAKLAPGRAALARAAAVRSVATMRSTPLASRVAAVRAGNKSSGSGLVAGYTRVQAGRTIRVQGYNRR